MNIDLRLGDCIEVLKTFADNSVDSIVTDSPYGLSFMNKHWDYDVPTIEVWTECLRVLKPGGHLLSFAGSRTYHRMAVRIEDAGFEIRDQIMWVYGSGFPKSHNIGKAIDKIEGNERQVLGTKEHAKKHFKDNLYAQDPANANNNKIFGYGEEIITKGNSDWEGWGTALKPAHEPIVMARKPLSEKSIAENVLKHGTGGINIDGSRIGTTGGETHKGGFQNEYVNGKVDYENGKGVETEIKNQGRWPANIIFDEEAGKLLDEQSGISKSTPSKGHHRKNNTTGDKRTPKAAGMFGDGNWLEGSKHNDKGGASRFFYCPKTSKKDRNEGLDNFEDKVGDIDKQAKRRLKCADCDNWYVSGNKEKECKCLKPNWIEPKTKNNHPTVKPTDLMRYLINLVTPKGGTTLDPFMGSGSTGKAAVRCGVNFIGIEKEEEYMKIAEARINYEKNKPRQQELF